MKPGFHFRTGSDVSRAEEQTKVHFCLSGSAKPVSARCLFPKTVVIGWFSTPPFSGRYYERLDSASGLPFCIPGL